MAGILRGEIYWADLNPVRGSEQAGFRPVVILSHEIFNRRSGTAIAVAITSQPQRSGFPLTLALPDDQLPRPSWIKISQIRTISMERLGKRLGAVDKDVLDRMIDGLLELIG
ncbi:MAG: type II toxin-antitoxin system PemK/MazF family toxin [Acidobacteria bacterium]|nr:type II toxin-antitoxin system PemK/MazF family toxin [Acidobacteriota bacterium]